MIDQCICFICQRTVAAFHEQLGDAIANIGFGTCLKEAVKGLLLEVETPEIEMRFQSFTLPRNRGHLLRTKTKLLRVSGHIG